MFQILIPSKDVTAVSKMYLVRKLGILFSVSSEAEMSIDITLQFSYEKLGH